MVGSKLAKAPGRVAERRFTVGEEIAHSITHGVGALASFVGLGMLVGNALMTGDRWRLVSAAVFGSTLASFNVEDFSLNRMKTLDMQDILDRFAEFRQLSHVEEIPG
jgi:predicted membrane channel-forming protein YqfA (hemolysin III family)